MTPLSIKPDLTVAPLEVADPATAQEGRVTQIGLMPNATDEGRAVVAMVVVLEDGREVVAATTWRLLHSAVRALSAGPVGSQEVMD